MINIFKRKNKINLAFCSDDNLLWVLPTVLNSIFSRNKPSNIIAHVLYNGDKTESEARGLIKKSLNENFECIIYKVNTESIADYEGLIHVSRATMNRLLIEKCLQDIKGRVLYLDLDVIVNADLSWANSAKVDQETGIAGRTEHINWCQRWTKKFYKYKYDKPFNFNAGVLLFDLEILRRNNFSEKVAEIWESCPKYNDQMILSIYCDGKYSQLPDRFNILAGERRYPDNNLTLETLNNKEDFIMHYSGEHKPWSKDYTHPIPECIEIWKQYEIKRNRN